MATEQRKQLEMIIKILSNWEGESVLSLEHFLFELTMLDMNEDNDLWEQLPYAIRKCEILYPDNYEVIVNVSNYHTDEWDKYWWYNPKNWE